MTLEDFLKSKGIEDVGSFVADMKANRLYISSEENMDERYPKLKAQKAEVDKSIEALTAQVAELNAKVEGYTQAEETYKTQIAEKDGAFSKYKLEAIAKQELLKAGAKDLDYLMYKLGDKLELTEDGSLKDWDTTLGTLKTDYGHVFAGKEKIEAKSLPRGSEEAGKTDYSSMSYKERLSLYEKDPKAFGEAAK